ncbi:hypothetical protein [Sutcliffiella cohnii]|uniref:hypothetical protein n=1 Tax=Sutcliffiella cohnii TaxID=33932 RepID=UPI000AA499F8|nr:hypothetical protein [Sutcliffiella cohnii]
MLSIFRKKNKYLSIRKELRLINTAIKKATYEIDAALIEELLEEKYKLIESVK